MMIVDNEKSQVIFLCVEKRLSSAYPAFFLDVDEETLIEKIVKQFSFLEQKNFNFVVDSAKNEKILRGLFPLARFIRLPGETKGCGCSALYAACQMELNNPVWVVSTNEITLVDYEKINTEFISNTYDVGLIGFKSLSPNYAYALLDGKGVIRVCQYQQISDTAISGVVFFRKTGDLVESLEDMILKEACNPNGKYYVSESINEMILKSKNVFALEIEKKKYIPLKMEADKVKMGEK